MMNKRKLGTAGFEIGEVGLGCWQLGGDFGPMEASTAGDILNAAVESGTDFFDTANVYGGGRSESLIGEFLQGCGQPVRVATKYGRGPDAYPDKYTESGLRSAIDAALERLKVSCIDLLQLHCIPMEALRKGDVFTWLRRACDEGVIRHFGASVETVDEGLLCLRQEGLLSLQVIFNIFRQKLIKELFPEAQSAGVGIIVRLPLASGLLAGKFTHETTFDPSDHRNYNRDGQAFNPGETFAGLPFDIGVDLAGELRSHVPEGMNMAQFALRWILDHEAVSVIIPGASSVHQAVQNASISSLPRLPEALHAALSAFYQEKVEQHIRGPY